MGEKDVWGEGSALIGAIEGVLDGRVATAGVARDVPRGDAEVVGEGDERNRSEGEHNDPSPKSKVHKVQYCAFRLVTLEDGDGWTRQEYGVAWLFLDSCGCVVNLL